MAKPGSLIIKELIRRNLDVAAIVRSKNKLEENVFVIEKDVYSLSADDIKDVDAHGERTGHYQLAGEVLTRNAAGKSYISYADYAIALADEIEHAAHLNQRISVYS